MSERNDDRFNFDFYSLLTDVAKNLWAIFLGAIAVVLAFDLFTTVGTSKTYSTKATFVVTSRAYSTNVYSNLRAAENMAGTLTNILNSDVLKKEVCKDIGMENFDATVKASVIQETNLLELNVSSDTPLKTFLIIRSIMDNYGNLTKYVNSNTIMQVLEEPFVPMHANTGVRDVGRLRKIFIVSFIVLLLLFAYLSYKHDTIKSEFDLNSKLDAKALGVIDHEGRKLFSRKRPLVTDVEVSFTFVEQYKKVVARLVTVAEQTESKTIMITSVSEHEGKSNVAANIAYTLAQQNYRTVLIDCDLRRPTQVKQLDLKEELKFDLVDLLDGKASFREAVIEKNGLYILGAKKNYSHSTEIVSSENLRTLFKRLKKAADYIIVDTPPMGILGDAEAIADQVDMTTLVVQYNRVLTEDLNDAIDSLNNARSDFGGTILNNLYVLAGTHQAAVSGGYGRYGKYGSYGKYGKYGRYGRYGRYGNYGHYAERDSETDPESEAA